MSDLHTLKDVLVRREKDLDFKIALRKAKDVGTLITILRGAQLDLPPEELKKLENMLELKMKKTLNVDLEKKSNR